MLNKVSTVARIAGLLLAIVAGFMPNLGFDAGMILIVLGLLSGISMPTERVMPVGVFVLVAPAIAGALGHVPAVGTQLGGVFGALAVLAAASLATGIALMLFNRTKDDLASLSK